MYLQHFLKQESIVLNLQSQNSDALLAEIIEKSFIQTKIFEASQKTDLLQTLKKRESLSSTAFKDGFAIPHGKVEGLNNVVGAIGVHKEGIPFQKGHEQKSHIFFVIFSPLKNQSHHLKALARIARLFSDRQVRNTVKNSQNVEDLYRYLLRCDSHLDQKKY